MPQPVKPGNTPPAEPTITAGARVADLINNVTSLGAGSRLERKLIQVSPLAQRGEYAELRLNLILHTEVSTASVLSTCVLERRSDEVHTTASRIKLDYLAREQNTAGEPVNDLLR